MPLQLLESLRKIGRSRRSLVADKLEAPLKDDFCLNVDLALGGSGCVPSGFRLLTDFDQDGDWRIRLKSIGSEDYYVLMWCEKKQLDEIKERLKRGDKKYFAPDGELGRWIIQALSERKVEDWIKEKAWI